MHWNPARVSLCLALAAALGGTACSRATRTGDAGPPMLTFTNQSIAVATVYAIRSGGDAIRLASVTPGRSQTLDLPASISTGGTITIVAVPLAGNWAASSGPITITPGTRLEITLPTSTDILRVLPARTP